MPKCVKCDGMFPPQLMREIEGVSVKVSKCIFCAIDKDQITFPPDENGIVRKYTREESKKEYLMFLNMLKEKLKDAEDLKKFLKYDIDGMGDYKNYK